MRMEEMTLFVGSEDNVLKEASQRRRASKKRKKTVGERVSEKWV